MQFKIFLACVSLGIASGLVYDVLYFLRCIVFGTDAAAYKRAGRICLAVADALYFAVFAAAFVFMSVALEFYEFRLYMAAGCAVGAIIYIKSFHIIVAFFVKKVYNKTADRVKRLFMRKNRRKEHE